MKKSDEVLVIGWCDNGFTDSLFASHMFGLVNHVKEYVKGIGFTQTIGNQIARQRGDVLKNFEETGADWLLWVDSDIVMNLQAFEKVWESRDAKKRPVVCGVYFVTLEMNQTLPMPAPCIFRGDGDTNFPVHPLPEDELIPIDLAGLGFCLMHKSVAKKLREKYGNTTFEITIGDQHVSEDVSFFKKLMALKIPVFAHTGALVQHMKRFSLDHNYYHLWWQTIAPLRQAQQQKE